MHGFITVRTAVLAAILALLCLSATQLSAQEMDWSYNGEIQGIVIYKPPSFAESNRTVEPIDLFVDTEPVQPEKHVLISLADQRMWVFEGNMIMQRFPVSTGVPGHRTPTGTYSVHNMSTRAYSNRYECYMLHWMAITRDGMYGMHGLEGTSYLRHLGSVASHGCIRLGPEDAIWLYEWAEIGIRVEIVDDWEEPPQEKQAIYRIESRICF